jgi:hypothetical protein
MTKFRERHFQNLPRRNTRKLCPSWGLFVKIDGDNEILKRYFGAYGGGMAKSKALPKLQGLLLGLNLDGSPPVDAILKRVDKGGKGAPAYGLRERYSFCMNILSTRRPSRVFKEI